jgi:hypothetical protein
MPSKKGVARMKDQYGLRNAYRAFWWTIFKRLVLLFAAGLVIGHFLFGVTW